jgi:hypothetical protein
MVFKLCKIGSIIYGDQSLIKSDEQDDGLKFTFSGYRENEEN